MNFDSIPESYKIISVLGEGSYGVVLKCQKPGTETAVAVKMAKNSSLHSSRALKREASLLHFLMLCGVDKFNIVKFHGEVYNKYGDMGLEYELLDGTLWNYFSTQNDVIPMEHIRTLTRDLAVAFSALKRADVIHSDFKMDNVMFVDQINQPFRVKLIDFGLAHFQKEANVRANLQPYHFRAPEMLLGLPFSEAIDIWSLGITLCQLVFKMTLLPAKSDSEALHFIWELLGPPPEHMLKDSCQKKIFKKVEGSWAVKLHKKLFGILIPWRDNRSSTNHYRSLNEMAKRAQQNGSYTSAELTQFVELLKAMLQWDPKDRITADGILDHTFISGRTAERN